MTIDEFSKIELRTAQILAAERVPNSDKLVKLRLSLGATERTLVAGIGKAYAPEALVGRTIVIVANLDQRTFKIKQADGSTLELVSEGMLLAAHSADGAPILLAVDGPAAPGSAVG